MVLLNSWVEEVVVVNSDIIHHLRKDVPGWNFWEKRREVSSFELSDVSDGLGGKRLDSRGKCLLPKLVTATIVVLVDDALSSISAMPNDLLG